MFKVWYRADYMSNTVFVSRWFWESPLSIYDKAKKQLGTQYINGVKVQRVK